MNCTQCRAHFSDYLENAVTPVLERELSAHFKECQGCAADLRQLEVAMARLRNVNAVAAPPGLAANVTGRLLATPLAATRRQSSPESSPEFNSEPTVPRSGERFAREPERTWPWATLAAASLLVAAACFFAGHLVSGGSATETLAALEISRRRVEGLEKQLSDTRTKMVEENSALRNEVMSLTSGLDQWKIEHASALEIERETRRGLDRRLQETIRQVETQTASLAAIRARLDATVEERNVAITDNEALARKLALATTRRAAETRRRLASASEWPPDSHESREVPPVLFVREGDILRLKTRGSLDEIGPHLFTFAESDAEPEIADLALTMLESHLEPFALEKEVEDTSWLPGRARLVGWFNRQVGATNAAPEAGEGSTDRNTRLERLRRIWQAR